MAFSFIGGNATFLEYLRVSLILTAGTCFLLWLGDEITRKMNAKVVVQDSYNEIIWQRNLKNWYYYLPTDGHKSFANTMFFYYYEDTNQMELANLFFDEEKSEFLILAEYFEIEACTKEFREKVETTMNIHYN